MREKIEKHLDLTYPKHILGGYQFGAQSCEMIAESLFTTFGLDECTVREDEENWGRIKK